MQNETKTPYTILLVEDEPAVRNLASRVLRRRGYHVIEAVDGGDALRIANAYDGTIALIVTDLIMPGLDGPRLAQALVPSRPEMRVLFMSGYTEADLPNQGVLSGAEFLGKPFLPDDLLRVVVSLLDRERGAELESHSP